MSALPTRRDRENERYAALREEFETERAYWKEGYEHDQREIEFLRAELTLVNDTLRHRTESHGRLVRDRLACPHCSTLPTEETPSE